MPHTNVGGNAWCGAKLMWSFKAGKLFFAAAENACLIELQGKIYFGYASLSATLFK
jgi:hypothetical protein